MTEGNPNKGTEHKPPAHPATSTSDGPTFRCRHLDTRCVVSRHLLQSLLNTDTSNDSPPGWEERAMAEAFGPVPGALTYVEMGNKPPGPGGSPSRADSTNVLNCPSAYRAAHRCASKPAVSR